MIDPTKICQIEIQVSDLERAKIFYENTFGWKTSPAELHQYVVLDVPKHSPFGISLVPGESSEMRNSVVIYFEVEHAENVVAAVIEAGGKLRFGPKKIPPYGQVWQVSDPDGNRFGLYQKV